MQLAWSIDRAPFFSSKDDVVRRAFIIRELLRLQLLTDLPEGEYWLVLHRSDLFPNVLSGRAAVFTFGVDHENNVVFGDAQLIFDPRLTEFEVALKKICAQGEEESMPVALACEALDMIDCGVTYMHPSIPDTALVRFFSDPEQRQKYQEKILSGDAKTLYKALLQNRPKLHGAPHKLSSGLP